MSDVCSSDFVGSVQITGGDQRYSYESECLAAGKKLDAGERCNVIVKFNESGAAGSSAAQQTAEPELLVMGNSKTPGGSIIPIETRTKILPVGADGAFEIGRASCRERVGQFG